MMNYKPAKKARPNGTFSYNKMLSSKLSSPPIRFDPYRKYDATVLQVQEETGNLVPLDIVTTSRKEPGNKRPEQENSLKKTDSNLGSAESCNTMNTESTGINFNCLENMISYTGSFNNDNYSHPELLKVCYNFECFHLNSNDIFKNPTNPLSYLEYENLKESYSSCLPLAKNCFIGVSPIQTLPNVGGSLEYDEELDDGFTNFHSLTEIEFSLLQKISCGCKSLSWDEYEKMVTIQKPKIHSCGINESKNKASSSFGCKDLVNDFSFKKNGKKIIINEFKFYHHKNDEGTLSLENKSIDGTKKQLKDDLDYEDDPLANTRSQIEMVDVENSVNYINEVSDDDDLVIDEPTSPLCTSILAFNMEEIEVLKERMKAYSINKISSITILDEAENANSLASSTLNKEPENNGKRNTSSGDNFDSTNENSFIDANTKNDVHMPQFSDLLSNIISNEIGIEPNCLPSSSTNNSECSKLFDSSRFPNHLQHNFESNNNSSLLRTSDKMESQNISHNTADLSVIEVISNNNSLTLENSSAKSSIENLNKLKTNSEVHKEVLPLDKVTLESLVGKVITNAEIQSLIKNLKTNIENTITTPRLEESNSKASTSDVNVSQPHPSSTPDSVMLIELQPHLTSELLNLCKHPSDDSVKTFLQSVTEKAESFMSGSKL